MQSYVDKCFRWSFFLVLVLISVLHRESYASSNAESVSPDTLYQQWSKAKTGVPLMLYEFIDFNHSKDQAQEFIKNHQPGLVSLWDGDQSDVSRWIAQVKSQQAVSPIFVCELRDIFELPFTNQVSWPSYLEVEAVNDQELIYQLGAHHGLTLKNMGFDIVYTDWIPPNYEAQPNKLKSYFKGITNAGLGIGLGLGAIDYGYMFGWDNVCLLDAHLHEAGTRITKERARFRRKTGFKGLIAEELLPYKNSNHRKNQLDDGAGVIRYTEGDGTAVLDWLNSDIKTKSCMRGKVKSFYDFRQKVKNNRGSVDGIIPQEELLAQLSMAAKVLISDTKSIIPVTRFKEFLITASKTSLREFDDLLDHHMRGEHWTLDQLLIADLNEAESRPDESIVLIDLAGVTQYQEFMDIRSVLLRLQKSQDVVVLSYGNQLYNKELRDFDQLLWSPTTGDRARIELLEIVLGLSGVSGSWPSYYHDDTLQSLTRNKINRIDFRDNALPQVNYQRLEAIDSIIHSAIQNHEIPGCQILMVKDHQVVYDRSFGYHTYDSVQHVNWEHLYDIASVTKTTATVPSVMHEVEAGRVSIDGELGQYIPFFESTNKADIKINKLLTHESGLLAYYPFWDMVKKQSPRKVLGSNLELGRYQSVPQSNQGVRDSINAWIARSRFNKRMNADSTFRYLYSDIGFVLLQQIVENTSNQPLDQYVQDMFYHPLGMNQTTYNPLNSGVYETIPTEEDHLLRKTLLDGLVHDRNAGVMGGVSGHAGLFANATDLAKYMQMIMDGGEYGGEQYFEAETIKKFTSRPDSDSQRALGWDVPRPKASNCSKYASNQSFGHSGFTGTLVWADPEYDFIYVFLSNRVYPDAKNFKLVKNNTRTKIHDVMYESFLPQHKIKESDI